MAYAEKLRQPWPMWLWPALALGAGVLGAAQARALTAAPPTQVPDLAFKLAAATALPLPLAALQWLSRPLHAALRRQLGESDRQRLAHSLRLVLLAAGALGAVAIGQVLAWPTIDGVRLALMTASAVALTAGLASAGVLLALQAMARQAGALTALTGGGAFGPAEAAPLLYAPALGLVAAMLPVAVMSALWAAAPDVATPAVFGVGLVGCAALAAVVATRQARQAGPVLSAAWLVVEQAHATPWRDDAPLPQPGPALRLFDAPLAKLLGLAWTRRWPGSAWASAGLAALGLWWADTNTPAWWWAWWAMALAAYGAGRAGAVEREGALVAATWLGAAGGAERSALAQLGLGLSWPSLAALAVGLWHPQAWPWLIGGLAAGVGLAIVALWRVPAGWRPWLGPAALLAWLAATGL